MGLPSPHDVVFYFPRSKRELWANSTVLEHASPYWATLLKSEFVETNTNARESEAIDDHGSDSDDSDREADCIPIDGVHVRKALLIPAGVKEVVVKHASYTTYRAVLVCVHSGHISFGRLRPASSTSILPSKLTFEGEVVQPRGPAVTPPPDLPLAASPKSVYKLADLLEMPDLAKLALGHFVSQLTVSNVLHQLKTDIAAHADVRERLVAFAAADWGEVRQQPELKDLE